VHVVLDRVEAGHHGVGKLVRLGSLGGVIRARELHRGLQRGLHLRVGSNANVVAVVDRAGRSMLERLALADKVERVREGAITVEDLVVAGDDLRRLGMEADLDLDESSGLNRLERGCGNRKDPRGMSIDRAEVAELGGALTGVADADRPRARMLADDGARKFQLVLRGGERSERGAERFVCRRLGRGLATVLAMVVAGCGPEIDREARPHARSTCEERGELRRFVLCCVPIFLVAKLRLREMDQLVGENLATVCRSWLNALRVEMDDTVERDAVGARCVGDLACRRVAADVDRAEPE
jgi:hypothetical protein